jgi:hypothetical protein
VKREWRAGLVAAVLLVAGCGGDEKPEQATTTSAPPVTVTTLAPTTSTIDPGDLERLRQSVLTAGDMPDGWTVSPSEPEAIGGDEFMGRLNVCLGAGTDSESRLDHVSGPRFQNGDNTVRSDASVYATADALEKQYRELSDPKNFTCIGDVLKTVFARMAGGVVASLAKTDVTVSPIAGLESNSSQVALRVKVSVAAGGQSITLYADVLAVRDGRFESSMLVAYLRSPPPVELEQLLLAAARNRLAASAS